MGKRGEKLLALGRLKRGEMNKTETMYFNRLTELKNSGKIQDFWFEGITLKLAENCRYTPDFLVLSNSGVMYLLEVKGSAFIFKDDAKVKVKVCSEKFPFPLIVVAPQSKKNGGGWECIFGYDGVSLFYDK